MNFLAPQSHIRILCTARYAYKNDILDAIKLLEKWGFEVSLGESIDKIHHQFGGTIDQRARDFQNALEDENVDYIWIARGGYGTVQIIDKLHLDGITLSRKHNKKTLIGYSDVTYLHAIWHKLGLQSIHSFMPLELGKKTIDSVSSLKKALTNETTKTSFPNTFQLKSDRINATITGGNLSILYALLGSDDFPDTDGKILFIEDIDEYLYHLERMMYSLKRSGALNNLKALLIGGMTDMNDHDIPFGKNAHEIINDITSEFDYPIIYNFPAGHIKDHRAIIFNHPTEIEIKKKEITIIQ